MGIFSPADNISEAEAVDQLLQAFMAVVIREWCNSQVLLSLICKTVIISKLSAFLFVAFLPLCFKTQALSWSCFVTVRHCAQRKMFYFFSFYFKQLYSFRVHSFYHQPWLQTASWLSTISYSTDSSLGAFSFFHQEVFISKICWPVLLCSLKH